MKISGIFGLYLIFFISIWIYTNKDAFANPSGSENPTQKELVAFAKCMTEKGWVMYGSFTCSACRAQRKAFGKAFIHIKEIECNPHAPNTQVELCLKRKIKKTPTWIMEKNGKVVKRVEGYQLLESLAPASGCEF